MEVVDSPAVGVAAEVEEGGNPPLRRKLGVGA